jgi:hypothetical protein
MARGRGEPVERDGVRRRREARMAGEGERSSDNSRHGFGFEIGERVREVERWVELKALDVSRAKSLLLSC